MDFWKQTLAGLPVFELPSDYPRPPVLTFRGDTETSSYPRALYKGLKALGQQEDATLFMTALAGYIALLYRYTGQEDVVVGSPVSGRTHKDHESLVGTFVNTLV